LLDFYVLTKGDGTFQGDVCGMVRAGETLYAVAIDNDGANIFTLDAATGLQTSSTPVVTIPPSNPADAETYPRPCRGVMADGVLYLVEFKGAGALTSSRPHPLYVVDVANGTHATPMDGFQLNAWRSVAVNREGNRLFLLDPSWSVDSVNRGVLMNRIYVATITAPGQLETPVPFTTQTRSDDNCESTNHWPGTLVVADVGGVESLLLGHDLGVETYDARDLSWTGSVDMTSFGRLFGQLTAAPGNPTRLYAVPQCKALTANSDFTLPYAGGTEPSDKNLVAALDASGETLVVAATNLDINGDGTFDHGIDLDFWAVKAFIRGAGSLLPIPPVVFTAPQVAVGRTLLFVRGTGIQGNGSTSLSSSGLGQVQDVGFFDLSTGAGLVFNGYMPWRHGLSAEAGTGAAIWGWDVWRGRESSVGWLEYLP
jgi:hypothetical protein